MKKYLIQTTCVLAFSAISCWAGAMHGYCSGSLQCFDNNTNSPTTNNPPTGFGFTIDGGGTGTLLIDILVPNNDDPNPSALSFDLVGTLTGTATLFSPMAWTNSNNFLGSYLGISATPKNPIGNYLGPCSTSTPCTGTVDPGATGFYVYQVSFSNATLESVPDPNTSPLENFAPSDPALPMGSFIMGYFSKGSQGKNSDWTATANSGAIFVDAAAPDTNPIDQGGTASTPEPSSIILLGFALLGFAIFLRRKAQVRA